MLKTTIDQLIADEHQLDVQCRHMRMELEQTQRNPEYTYYAYVTRDDLVDCFGDNVVLTLRNFDYYDKDVAQRTMTVVSENQTPIDVRLVTQEGSGFQAPPLADALASAAGADKRSPSPEPSPVDRLGKDTAMSTAFLLSSRQLRKENRLRRRFERMVRSGGRSGVVEEEEEEDDDEDDGSSSECR